MKKSGLPNVGSAPTCPLLKTAYGHSSPKLGEVPLGGGVCQFSILFWVSFSLPVPKAHLNFQFKNTRPRPSGTPSNLEGDVVGRHRKIGKRADLTSTQNRQRLPLPTSPFVGEGDLEEEFSQLSTLNSQLSTLNSQFSILNSQFKKDSRVTKMLPESLFVCACGCGERPRTQYVWWVDKSFITL